MLFSYLLHEKVQSSFIFATSALQLASCSTACQLRHITHVTQYTSCYRVCIMLHCRHLVTAHASCYSVRSTACQMHITDGASCDRVYIVSPSTYVSCELDVQMDQSSTCLTRQWTGLWVQAPGQSLPGLLLTTPSGCRSPPASSLLS